MRSRRSDLAREPSSRRTARAGRSSGAAVALGDTGPAPRGGYAVQVAAVRYPAAVPGTWRRLRAAHPGLAGLDPRPARRVDVPGKGAFFRVAGGSFATKAEAQARCERLRAEGADCGVLGP